MHDAHHEPIIAQCTPRGSGALALLRLTGENTLEIAENIGVLASGQKISALPTHTVHYGTIVDAQGITIDQVMFIVMRGPKTFTGQDTVEITCHNNPFIVEAIIEQAIAHGARLAQEGEFSKRAYLNKKIDLVQAEAINELIHANTHLALKKSLSQLKGSFSHWIATLEKELLRALALSDASFEFIDDEASFGNEITTLLTNTLETIAVLKKTFGQQHHIRQGVRVALIGSVNAGKSSLFNALLNRDRAIVTPIAGTTRDALEAGLYRNGIYWTLVDTAGLRQTNDTIEREGIVRSYQEAHAADVVLLVVDRSRPMTEAEKNTYADLQNNYEKKIILVHNKTDLPAQTPHQPSALDVSVNDKAAIAQLENAVEQKVTALFADAESPFLLNQRQGNLLLTLEKKLLTLQAMMRNAHDFELISYELKEALTTLSELTGNTISEQGMDAIFRTFCIGK